MEGSRSSVPGGMAVSFGAGQFEIYVFGELSVILGGTDSISSHSYVPTMDKKQGVPVAPVVPVSYLANKVLSENGVSSLYRKFIGLKLEVRLRTKGSISFSRSIMNGSRQSWRHDKFLSDKSCREEFGSSDVSSRLSRQAGLGHLSSVFYDRVIKIIVEKHFEGNMATADVRLRRLGRGFVYVYCQAVLFPELCAETYAEVLGSYYLAEAVFTKLTRVDKDKGLEAKFRLAMETCKV